MKKLLVVGASVLQLPAIKRAKELGFYVVTVDRDPHAVGIPYADIYFQISTIDAEGIYQVARDLQADGIMTLATDMPMRAIANASMRLGLPAITPKTAENATDKGKMISVFKENSVSAPRYEIIKDRSELNQLCKKFDYPFILKPVDNSGSRGVVLVNQNDQIHDAYQYSLSHSRNGEVIIEEYLQGREVSVETFSYKDQVNVLAITDKLTTGAPHFVEMGHSQPTCLPVLDKENIAVLAKKAVNAIGIDLGPAHVEIMLTKSGPKLIELGARLGGDCITSHLVPLSTGIDMVGAAIACSIGEDPDLIQKINQGSAIRYFDVPAGIFSGVDGLDQAIKIPGVKEITFSKKIGDCIGDISSSGDRIGFVIAQKETAEEAVKVCESALRAVKITIRE